MDAEHWIKTVIRGVMCLTGIVGNTWLLISSLPKSLSQLRTNEMLFVNLAVSNLITNYIVDTLNIFYTEHFIPAGNLFCGIQFFLPEFSETSSILTTMFITVYWYQKLVGSLKRGGAPVRMDNLQFTTMLLMGSWTFSFVFNFPHFLFAIEHSGNITAEECKEELPSPEAGKAYEVVYITLVNIIPLTAVLYASIQITITLIENGKRMKGMSTAVKNEGNVSTEKSGDNTNDISAGTKSKSQAKTGSLERAAKSVLAVAICFLICWVIHLFVRVIDPFVPSSAIEDIESYIGASYTSVIPYIYLHGAQKLTCSSC